MEDTKDRILNASLELFSELGYLAVSTKSIARAAGVNEVTIFRNFGSKRNLYLEVYRTFSVKVDGPAILKGMRHELEPDLATLGREFASIFIRTMKLVRMGLRHVRTEFPEIDRDLKAQIGDIASVASTYFQEMRALGFLKKDPEPLAGILSGLLFGYAMHLMKQGNPERLEGDLDELMGIFARGIGRF